MADSNDFTVGHSFRIFLTNYNQETTIEITYVIDNMSIYEDMYIKGTTCSIIVNDAANLLTKTPIVGEEYITIEYKSKGLGSDKEELPLRRRSFRVYKIVDQTEVTDKQTNYKLLGIDDHYYINEAIDLNKSYVGQNCTEAITNIFTDSFIKLRQPPTGQNVRPFNIQKKLYGLGTEDVVENSITSQYIAPGSSPFEAIDYLKNEAQHKDTNNTDDYVFFQDVDGFHLTTMSELKSQDTAFVYRIKDPTLPQNIVNDEEDPTELTNSIIEYKVRKSFDDLENLNAGMYGNRVVCLDLLTKKLDEKSFNYINEYRQLTPIDGPTAGRLASEEGLYKYIGSTQTRYITTDLTTTSLNTGIPSQFSTGALANYQQTPYFSLNGSEDPRIVNAKRNHFSLNHKIASKAVVNNIIIDLTISGNSDLKIGQVIELFIPANKGVDLQNQTANRFYGINKPRFLVVRLKHIFLNDGAGTYLTSITAIKDSYERPLEIIYEAEKESSQYG